MAPDEVNLRAESDTRDERGRRSVNEKSFSALFGFAAVAFCL
jgi:hypothetical protein